MIILRDTMDKFNYDELGSSCMCVMEAFSHWHCMESSAGLELGH